MKKFNQFMAEANICPVCNSEPCACPGGDNHITESDAAWAAAEAKRKEQEAKKALTKKDASTVDKIRAMMAKEKMKEEVDEGLKPGWMLKADPELAKKVKAKQDKHKAMSKAMGNPNAGKSVKEETELEEDMKSAAKEMHGYASNYGGIDKADFHKAAKHMEAGNHKALHSLIKKLDSDPRDKILTTLHKHGNDINRYGYSTRASRFEEVEENYVSHAQRKAVWANRADDGKGHPDNKKKMKKEEMDSDKKETPPFEGPYSKKKVATPGKQGYGMSAARHLARQALQRVMDKQKNK